MRRDTGAVSTQLILSTPDYRLSRRQSVFRPVVVQLNFSGCELSAIKYCTVGW